MLTHPVPFSRPSSLPTANHQRLRHVQVDAVFGVREELVYFFATGQVSWLLVGLSVGTVVGRWDGGESGSRGGGGRER